MLHRQSVLWWPVCHSAARSLQCTQGHNSCSRIWFSQENRIISSEDFRWLSGLHILITLWNASHYTATDILLSIATQEIIIGNFTTAFPHWQYWAILKKNYYIMHQVYEWEICRQRVIWWLYVKNSHFTSSVIFYSVYRCWAGSSIITYYTNYWSLAHL